MSASDRPTFRRNASAMIMVVLAGVAAFFVFARATPEWPAARQIKSTNTWSIVAVDPQSGDVGLAVASCVPNWHADVVAALAPGKGAAATQAEFELANRNAVFEMLQAGETAAAIIEGVTDPAYDAQADSRQYGVVTIRDGVSSAAAFSGAANQAWAGDRQEPDHNVTVQGNFLASEEVVAAALAAFSSNDGAGYNTLPDRLMRALEAGSAAGGDARCNNDQVTQTAATAAILVARGGDPPYAAAVPGESDAGTPAAPWLALSVTEARFGRNPILELRRQYDAWRPAHLESPGEGTLMERGGLAAIAIALLMIIAIVVWNRILRVDKVS